MSANYMQSMIRQCYLYFIQSVHFSNTGAVIYLLVVELAGITSEQLFESIGIIQNCETQGRVHCDWPVKRSAATQGLCRCSALLVSCFNSIVQCWPFHYFVYISKAPGKQCSISSIANQGSLPVLRKRLSFLPFLSNCSLSLSIQSLSL